MKNHGLVPALLTMHLTELFSVSWQMYEVDTSDSESERSEDEAFDPPKLV